MLAFPEFSQRAVQGGCRMQSVGNAPSHRATDEIFKVFFFFFLKLKAVEKQTQIALVAQCVTETVCWTWVGRHQVN